MMNPTILSIRIALAVLLVLLGGVLNHRPPSGGSVSPLVDKNDQRTQQRVN